MAEQKDYEIPKPLPWEQRANGVSPLPGGYSEYLESLSKICRQVEQDSLSFEQAAAWMQGEFDISEVSSRLRLRFLETAGLINSDDGIMRLKEPLQFWLEGGQKAVVIAIMHSRIKFIGEMLEELRKPKQPKRLQEIASNYGLDWERPTQINMRRGWLESAELITASRTGLELLPDGEKLLERLNISPPIENGSARRSTTSTTVEGEQKETLGSERLPNAEKLASEILESSTDSGNPKRFERAVRDGFQFMGFVAKHLGQSGQTDVLLTAPLGKDDSYRVAVDAKTVGSGSLKDSQVDWETLKEHQEKHSAQYSLLVAPNPTDPRLMQRANKNLIGVMSAEQFADLCLGHESAPLSLVDYKQLFKAYGEIVPTAVEERADQVVRLRKLAVAICRQLPERTDRFGPMSARDVWLSLDKKEAEGFSEDEIQGLLSMLSHPLIGAVYDFGKGQRNCSNRRYVLASSRDTCRRRIELLANDIAAPGQAA
ncbi:MAG: restriction endonuclease [Gammaproteobacteria bacterium]|nr:restriction endonuclease [Gammaproteobacteria bacterium]